MADEKPWRDWLKTVVDEGVNLTPWETSFIENLCDQRDRGGYLSERQIAILERIYSERTP